MMRKRTAGERLGRPMASLGRAGGGGCRRLRFERLERRLPLAGGVDLDLDALLAILGSPAGSPAPDDASGLDAAGLDAADQVDSDVIRVRLESPVREVQVGDRFTVDVLVQERAGAAGIVGVSPQLSGLFQAKVDLGFDPQVVQPVVEDIFLDERFSGSIRVEPDAPGVLRNVGGTVSQFSFFDAQTLPRNELGEFRLTSVPFRVLTPGDTAITAALTQDGESFLVFGSDFPVPENRIDLLPLELTIPPSADEPPVRLVPDFQSPSIPIAIAWSATASWDDRFAAPVERSLGWLATIAERSVDPMADTAGDARPDRSAGVPADRQLGRQPTGDPLGDGPIAQADRPDDQPDSEVSDDAAAFWLRYDLQTLDEEAIGSRFELHFRPFRLHIERSDWARPGSPDAEQADTKPSGGPPDHRRGSFRESVIDAGMADVSVWLSDPGQRSWRPEIAAGAAAVMARGTEKGIATGAQRAEADRAEADRAEADWHPRGKNAEPPRWDFREQAGDESAPADLRRPIADGQTEATTGD